MSGPILSIAVQGSGWEGWLAALALKRAAPFLDIAVSGGAPDGPAALLVRPADRRALAALGLTEAALFARAAASGCLGERIGDSFIPFGAVGANAGPVRFHHQIARLREVGEVPGLMAHSLAAALADEGRFSPGSDDPRSILSMIDHGLHVDAARFTGLIREIALEVGVREGPMPEAGLTLDAGDGEEQPGDWEAWPAAEDRIAAARIEDDAPPPPLLAHGGEPGAWTRRLPLNGARFETLVFHSTRMTDAQALIRLGASAAIAAFRPGRRTAPWTDRSIAVGRAAIQADPIAGYEVRAVLKTARDLAELLPHADSMTAEAREFNRRAGAESDHVRDYADLVRGRAPSPALAHRIALFTARGRVAQAEHDPYGEDLWTMALFAAGQVPRRHDPQADALETGALSKRAARIRQMVRQAADAAPSHAEFLRQQVEASAQ